MRFIINYSTNFQMICTCNVLLLHPCMQMFLYTCNFYCKITSYIDIYLYKAAWLHSTVKQFCLLDNLKFIYNINIHAYAYK